MSEVRAKMLRSARERRIRGCLDGLGSEIRNPELPKQYPVVVVVVKVGAATARRARADLRSIGGLTVTP